MFEEEASIRFAHAFFNPGTEKRARLVRFGLLCGALSLLKLQACLQLAGTSESEEMAGHCRTDL